MLFVDTLFHINLWRTIMSKSEDTLMKVLKKATCKTLSGKSTLTYHVGADSDDEIHVCVHANTGGGFFSNEWVSMKDIQSVLEEHPEGAHTPTA